jgi:hypothetical protein
MEYTTPPSSPSSDHTPFRQESFSQRQSWLEWGGILLVFFVYGAWPVPDKNEPYYVLKAIHFWHPDWIPNDTFLETQDSHGLFYATFGLLSFVMSPAVMAWTGRLLTWSLLAWSWRRLSVTLLPVRWLAVASAAGLAYYLDTFHMAGEWLIGGVEGKGFAYIFVFLGLEAMVRNRWRRVWIFFGFASAFHVLVGGWSVVAALLTWMLEKKRFRPSFLSMLPALVIGGLISLIGLVPALMLDLGVPAAAKISESGLTAHQIYVYERIAHHLVPTTLPSMFPLRFLFLAGFWALFCRLHRHGGPWRWAHAEEAPPTRANFVGFRRLEAFVFSSLLLASIGFALSLLPHESTAGLLRFYWFRLSDIAVPMGVALGSVALFYEILRIRIFQKDGPNAEDLIGNVAFLLLAAFLLMALVDFLINTMLSYGPSVRLAAILLAFALVFEIIGFRKRGKPSITDQTNSNAEQSLKGTTRWSLALLGMTMVVAVVLPLRQALVYAELRSHWTYPRTTPQGSAYNSWIEVCRWVRQSEEIPPGARFLTPRYSNSFKWFARQPEVAVWKEIPQDAPSIVDWYDTMEDFYATGQKFPKWYDTLSEALAGRSRREVVRLAKKYDFQYILASRRVWLDLPAVYWNRHFVVYSLEELLNQSEENPDSARASPAEGMEEKPFFPHRSAIMVRDPRIQNQNDQIFHRRAGTSALEDLSSRAELDRIVFRQSRG